MRTSNLAPFAFALILIGGADKAASLDAVVRPPPRPPTVGFGSARDALRTGVRDYNAGDKVGAARALEFAATQGHALALWKLGRMYADGDGVPQDDLKAFEYFSRIAEDKADEGPDSPNAAVISSAFVALGGYYLDGIKGSDVKPDAARAHEMFHYAASYFGDPNAQYNLARLYLEGTGVPKDVRQAARWFNLAAEKGHHQAQALLGQLLVSGQGVPRQRAMGLMWLTLARDAADPNEQWISELHSKAFETASELDRRTALVNLEQFLRRRR